MEIEEVDLPILAPSDDQGVGSLVCIWDLGASEVRC